MFQDWRLGHATAATWVVSPRLKDWGVGRKRLTPPGSSRDGQPRSPLKLKPDDAYAPLSSSANSHSTSTRYKDDEAIVE